MKAENKTKIPPKEATLKKLEKLGVRFPKGAYITAEHAYQMWCGMTGHGTKSETDSDIDSRLQERFKTMDDLVDMAIGGVARSIIVSGAPGLGKSYNIEKKLELYDPTMTKYQIVRGYSTVVNLYKSMYDNRHVGNLLVLDDCDAVRKDEAGMNLLKVATDTLDRRIVSYMAEGVRISEKDNSRIPNSFEFCGTLIFITNEDMDSIAQEDTTMGKHMEALMSRGHYCDLTLRTRREALIRIRQVVGQGLLSDVPERDRKTLLDYVEKHKNDFRDLSLRTVIKIKQFQQTHPESWERMSKNTLIPV